MHAIGAPHALDSAELSLPLVKPARSADHLLLLADQYRWWVLAAIAVVYLAGFNGQWHVEPDSALYLSIARNLAQGRGYTYHGHIAHLAYPGLPWLESATFQVFGIGVLWPIHALMILFALTAIALVYRLFWLHAGRSAAVVVTAMVAVGQSFYQYAFQLRNDMPFLAGVMGVLAGYEGLMRAGARGKRQWVDWVLLCAGLLLAMVMRPTMIPLVAVLIIAVGWGMFRRRGGAGRGGACAALLLAAVAVFILLDPRHRGGPALGGYESDIAGIFLHETRFIDTISNTWHIYIPQMVRSIPIVCFGIELGPGLNLLGAGLLLWLGLRLWRRRPLWGMWIAATVGMMLITLPRDRYFLPIVPLLAYGWWRWIAGWNRRLSVKWGNLVFCGLLALWMAPNAARLCGVAIAQRQRPFLMEYKQGKMAGVDAFARELASHVAPSAIVLAPEGMGRILTYLGDRTVLDAPEYGRIDPRRNELYCVLPMVRQDPSMMNWITAHDLRIGPAAVTVPRKGDLEPWTLHRLQKRVADSGIRDSGDRAGTKGVSGIEPQNPSR
jgi:hypothetical protein